MYMHTVMSYRSIVLCMQFCTAFMKLCHSVQVFGVRNDRSKVPRFSVCHPLHCSEWAWSTVGLGHVCTALATFARKVSYCHSANTVVLSQPEGTYCNAVPFRYGIGSFAMRRILHTFGQSFNTPAQLEEVCWCLHPIACSCLTPLDVPHVSLVICLRQPYIKEKSSHKHWWKHDLFALNDKRRVFTGLQLFSFWSVGLHHIHGRTF